MKAHNPLENPIMPLLIAEKAFAGKDDRSDDAQRGSPAGESGRIEAGKRAKSRTPRLLCAGVASPPGDEGLVDCVDTAVLLVYGDLGV